VVAQPPYALKCILAQEIRLMGLPQSSPFNNWSDFKKEDGG